MPSLNPPLTKDDFINSCWQDVVNSSEKKDCFTYNNGFWKKAEEAKEAGKIREQAVFGILGFITGVAIKSNQAKSTEEFFAKTFKDLTDEHLDFLAEIAPEISDPELQARVADILWVRREDYRMAQLAVSAYLQSAQELQNQKNLNQCFKRIERALRLAVNRKIRYQPETVVAHIEAVITNFNTETPLWLSAKLMELLQEYRLGDPTKYSALAETAATRAESSHDWDSARSYWEVKAKWHHLKKNKEKERAALMLAAETYIKEADDALKRKPPSYLTASIQMQKAIKAFRKIRDKGTKEETIDAKNREEEVHKLLLQYQEESRRELITISHKVNVSDEVEQARAQVRGKKFEDALFALAFMGVPTTVSHLRQRVQETVSLAPYVPVVMINETGKVVARQPSDPDKAEEATRFEMYRLAVEYQILHTQTYIEPAREQINLEHSVQINDLLPIVSNSPFVPQGREILFAKGLYAGLTGDFFTSTHILIPQIENSVRYVLKTQQNVRSSGLDNFGIQEERFLTTTLDPTKCPEITSIFDENTLFDLQGLLIKGSDSNLIKDSGSNLRNRMAHGLINDNEFLSPIMSYLWWVALRLCCLPILNYQQKVEQSDPWVKFAGMFNDDPLFDEFVEDMAAYRRELDAEVADDQLTPEENQPA